MHTNVMQQYAVQCVNTGTVTLIGGLAHPVYAYLKKKGFNLWVLTSKLGVCVLVSDNY